MTLLRFAETAQQFLREDERYLYGLVKLSLEEGKQYVSVGAGFMMELLTRLREARAAELTSCQKAVSGN